MMGADEEGVLVHLKTVRSDARRWWDRPGCLRDGNVKLPENRGEGRRLERTHLLDKLYFEFDFVVTRISAEPPLSGRRKPP
jgi:hypothetical protein